MDYDKRKVLIGLGAFLFILITSFSVFVLYNKGESTKKNEEKIERIVLLHQKEIEKKNEENTNLRTNINKEVREIDENKIVNSTKRFFEFIYDNETENYVTRKKDASNYMGDGMIERFFPSDNIVDNGQSVEVSNIEVYMKQDIDSPDDEEIKAIATYNLDVSIEENNNSEPMKVYMEVVLKHREGKYRVISLDEFNNEGVYDYE